MKGIYTTPRAGETVHRSPVSQSQIVFVIESNSERELDRHAKYVYDIMEMEDVVNKDINDFFKQDVGEIRWDARTANCSCRSCL